MTKKLLDLILFWLMILSFGNIINQVVVMFIVSCFFFYLYLCLYDMLKIIFDIHQSDYFF